MPSSPVVGHVAQPLVLAMETVFITQKLQRATEVLVVQTVTVRKGTRTSDTPHAHNLTLPASLDPEAHHVPLTAST